MAFDLAAIKNAVRNHRRVARVVVASTEGSSPREVGAAMLVWEGGQSGTIGGGELEFRAAKAARDAESDGFTAHALGPELGQCCGGAVTLLTEIFDADRLDQIEGPVFARGAGEMPLSVKRLVSRQRAEGVSPEPQMIGGWMIEPVDAPARPLWIWGAGHVGRALVSVLEPLPDFSITWVDTALERFPETIPESVTALPAARPELLAAHAPTDASHLILTYSHAMDLALCHAVLQRGFGFAGLIGSKTKWVRFRKRLAALGHSNCEIDRICCPIGQKALGKHPQAIAVGVAAALLNRSQETTISRNRVA